MPKMKSNRAAMKRFRVSASGKIKRDKAYANHILTSKKRGRKRRLRKGGLIEAPDMPRVRKLILL